MVSLPGTHGMRSTAPAGGPRACSPGPRATRDHRCDPAVPVLDGDDVQTLSARILEQEHIAYGDAIRMVLSGEYEIHGRRYLSKALLPPPEKG